jgi:hypothetical protein
MIGDFDLAVPVFSDGFRNRSIARRFILVSESGRIFTFGVHGFASIDSPANI